MPLPRPAGPVLVRVLFPVTLVLAVGLLACGGRPPPPANGVFEHNVSTWKYRRYQKLLDVEVWVKNNKATAFTASYTRGSADKLGVLGPGDVVNVFVTRYSRPGGILRAVVVFARRLAQEQGYQVEENKVEGVRLFVISGHGERWAMWSADGYVIKIGGRDVKEVPDAIIKAYGKPYPSTLTSGLLEGALPPEEDDADDDKVKKKPKYDPDNPSPDWDKYETGDIEKPAASDDDDDDDDGRDDDRDDDDDDDRD